MKNKIKFKKYILGCSTIFLAFLIFLIIVNIWEMKELNKNYNKTIGMIVTMVKNNYPKITEDEIMKILNSEEIDSKLLAKYNIDLQNESIVLENNQVYRQFLIIKISLFMLLFGLILVIMFLYSQKQSRELKKIIKYLERINNKDYNLEINELSEDELSILKNELYKITVMLKESAINSYNDKVELKKSLEDISHQLKTPLTSILITLDNLEDNTYDDNLKEEFIRDIKREVTNINFLVQNILKLSKFDANTIKFNKSPIMLNDLIKESVLNVATLCDLKNITIEVTQNKNIKVMLDYHWEVEALTNILKNCIEHSKEYSKILISFEENNAYTKIIIQDFGDGIAKEDLPHIFERFYKGKDSSNDSIGIGLSLAKTIIEKDNGSINVESNNGTTFEIRFYKF